MRPTLIIIVGLVLLLGFTSAKSISSILFDKGSSTVYIAESTNAPYLYEVRGHHLQAAFLFSAESNSLVIKKRGEHGHEHLYAISQNASALNLFSFKLPLHANKPSLKPDHEGSFGTDLTLAPLYDTKDSLLFASVRRNLTLVDMNTFEVLDTFTLWIGARNAGRNVIYNHNTKHLIVFETHVIANPQAAYGVDAAEYDVSTRKFVEVNTTYNCSCDTNPESSPFYRVVFAESSCKINYASNKIWCADPDHTQLFAFNAENLSEFHVVKTTAAFATVHFDFDSHKAFAINNDVSAGCAISLIDLANGHVDATYINATMQLDPSVSAIGDGHLYVAVLNDESVPAEVALFNAHTLELLDIITLTHN